jgi:Na+/H+ antiporter NhaA
MNIPAQYKSALRHFVLTAVAVWVANPDADVKALVAGVVAAILGPTLRALDKKDPAFGLVADKVVAELDKLAKKSRKKKG